MPLTLAFELILTSEIEGVDTENIGPIAIEDEDVTGDVTRRTVTLPEGKWTTLEVGSLVPEGWVLVNLSDTDQIDIGFGTGRPLKLPPQRFSMTWGSDIPRARPASGTPRLLYMVFAQTAP